MLREVRNEKDEDRRKFWASFGSWEDDRAAEEIIEEIYVIGGELWNMACASRACVLRLKYGPSTPKEHRL